MRSLEDVLIDLPKHDIVRVSYDQREKRYNGCRIRYDGEIMTEVDGLKVGNFFIDLPRIGMRLRLGDIYQIQYDFLRHVYQNIILVRSENQVLDHENWISPVYGFYHEDSDLERGLSVLDSKLEYTTQPMQIKKKNVRSGQ